MPWSTPSEKTIKTEPAKARETPFLPEECSKEYEAALELLSLLNTTFPASEGSFHAGALLLAAAWLTGTSLYQSLHGRETLLPGTIVEANQINQEWEHLVYLLEEYNFQRTDIPVGRVVLAAMAAPAFFRPQVDMSTAQNMLQQHYDAVLEKHGFEDCERTRVGILLCSVLIQQYSRAGLIDIDAATGVVAQGIFEAARPELSQVPGAG